MKPLETFECSTENNLELIGSVPVGMAMGCKCNKLRRPVAYRYDPMHDSSHYDGVAKINHAEVSAVRLGVAMIV